MSPYCAAPRAPYNASAATPYAVLRRIEPSEVRALDGVTSASCARSSAGVAGGAACADLGVGLEERWRRLEFLPEGVAWRQPAEVGVVRLANELHAHLTRLQAGREGCSGSPLYTVAALPTIGFCATIEYGMLSLARAASSGSRLVLGPRSAPTWSSPWLCGRERSLSCYFNLSLSSCCADETSFETGLAREMGGDGMGGAVKRGKVGRRVKRALTTAQGDQRRMLKAFKQKVTTDAIGSDSSLEYGRPRALSLGGSLTRFNAHGTLWVSAQLAHFFFSRMHPSIRAEVDRRRAAVLPRLQAPSTTSDTTSVPAAITPSRPLCIGLHVRRGDSCSLGSRFCPRNFTATYFEAAARVRAKYGINRLVLATDDASAAAMCAAGVLGFECRSMHMDRTRFDARESIERRVVHRASGLLSGSAVALDALADVEMLSECDAHVLVLRSAVSRLALALSVGRKGRHSPLISLQWPWGGLPGPPGGMYPPKQRG